MPDEEPVAPYTGRRSESASESPVAAAQAPRIRWGLISLVHLAAAFSAGFGVPVFATAFDPQWILIGLMSGVIVTLVGGGVTLGFARLGYHVATRGGRGWMRETAGVSLGALAGALPIGLLVGVVAGTYGLVLVAIIGIGSAIGLSIWVLVAWRPHLQSRPVR